MNNEDLKSFKDNVADKKMQELFSGTELRDGMCYIDDLEFLFLDGRNHGFDSAIYIRGFECCGGEVKRIDVEILDGSIAEFMVDHRNAIFVGDGDLHIVDELQEIELFTSIRRINFCANFIPLLGRHDNIAYISIPLAYYKMKDLYEDSVRR